MNRLEQTRFVLIARAAGSLLNQTAAARRAARYRRSNVAAGRRTRRVGGACRRRRECGRFDGGRESRRYAQKQRGSMTGRAPCDGLVNTRMRSRSRMAPFKRLDNGEAKWFLHDFLESALIVTFMSVKKKKKKKNPLGNFTSIPSFSSGHWHLASAIPDDHCTISSVTGIN